MWGGGGRWWAKTRADDGKESVDRSRAEVPDRSRGKRKGRVVVAVAARARTHAFASRSNPYSVTCDALPRISSTSGSSFCRTLRFARTDWSTSGFLGGIARASLTIARLRARTRLVVGRCGRSDPPLQRTFRARSQSTPRASGMLKPEEVASGAFAGLVGTVLGYPLDVVKSRMQTNAGARAGFGARTTR